MKPYYSDGACVIYHGDSRAIIPALPVGPPVKLVLTDPPYGTENEAGYGRKQNYGGEGRKIKNDSDLSMFEEVWPLALATLERGFFITFFSGRNLDAFIDITRGTEWFGHSVWIKGPGLGAPIRYSHENIGIYRVGGEEVKPHCTIISSMAGHASCLDHPHEKPIGVISRLAQFGCAEGELILDPFMGSGTSLVAAKNLGCRYIGIELDEKFCEVAARRAQQKVLAFRKPEPEPELTL